MRWDSFHDEPTLFDCISRLWVQWRYRHYPNTAVRRWHKQQQLRDWERSS